MEAASAPGHYLRFDSCCLRTTISFRAMAGRGKRAAPQPVTSGHPVLADAPRRRFLAGARRLGADCFATAQFIITVMVK